MCKQQLILKTSILATLLMGIFILSACGPLSVETNDEINDTAMAEMLDDGSNATNDTKFAEADVDVSDDLQKPPAVPVSNKAEDIYYYYNADDIFLERALHRSTADGKNIYLAYGEPDLYVLPLGADRHEPANMENPEGMDVLRVALDGQGQIHLLMADYDNGIYFIRRLNEDYRVDKSMDISAYFEHKERIPMWFMIDKDGTYYLQWPFDRSGIIVDADGTLKHKTTRESLGAQWIYEAAVGKDGHIYLVHGYPDENIEIARLNVEEGTMENVDSALHFPGDEVFSEMSAGTDSNLLLYAPYSGVWAYDAENGMLENRLKPSDVRPDFNDEFRPLVFLPDGRLVLMGDAANGDKANEGPAPCLLKYVPVGY